MAPEATNYLYNLLARNFDISSSEEIFGHIIYPVFDRTRFFSKDRYHFFSFVY